MLPATRFFDDERYLRTARAERRPAESAAGARRAARLAGCPAGGAILDAGCGEGRNAFPLAREGYRVVGLDRSRALLEAVPRHAGLRLVCGSYEAMPFRNSTFDAVLLLGTALGYSGNAADRQALREIRRVLAPGGSVVIETLHRDEIGGALPQHEECELPGGDTVCFDRDFDRWTSVLHESQRLNGGPVLDYELRVYRPTELARMVEDAGFEIQTAESSPVTPLVLVAGAAGRPSPP